MRTVIYNHKLQRFYKSSDVDCRVFKDISTAKKYKANLIKCSTSLKSSDLEIIPVTDLKFRF